MLDLIINSAVYFSARVRSLGKETWSTLHFSIMPTCAETYQKVTWNADLTYALCSVWSAASVQYSRNSQPRETNEIQNYDKLHTNTITTLTLQAPPTPRLLSTWIATSMDSAPFSLQTHRAPCLGIRIMFQAGSIQYTKWTKHHGESYEHPFLALKLHFRRGHRPSEKEVKRQEK